MGILRSVGQRLGIGSPARDLELEERLPETILGEPTARLSWDPWWAGSTEPSVKGFVEETAAFLGLRPRALTVAIAGSSLEESGLMLRAWRWRSADPDALWAALELTASLGVAPVGSGDQLQEIEGIRIIRTFSGEREFDMSGRVVAQVGSDDTVSFVKGDTWFEVLVTDSVPRAEIIRQIVGAGPTSVPSFALTLPPGWAGVPIRASDLWAPHPDLAAFADLIEPGEPKLAENLRPTPEQPLFGPMGTHSAHEVYFAVDLRQKTADEGLLWAHPAEAGNCLLSIEVHPTAYEPFEREVASSMAHARQGGVDLTSEKVELASAPAFHVQGEIRSEGGPPERISTWITRAGSRTYRLAAHSFEPADPAAIDRAIVEAFRPLP